MIKKVRPARPQELWRAERTAVREHDKGPRTQLAPFFSIPSLESKSGSIHNPLPEFDHE